MKLWYALIIVITMAMVVHSASCAQPDVAIQVDPYAAVQQWCDANPCACDDIGHKYLMEMVER